MGDDKRKCLDMDENSACVQTDDDTELYFAV